MEYSPRKLLCSWHIIKNWNIQGKKKIKDLELRKSMKMDLRKVLKATTEEKFIKASREYFDKIGEETLFKEYLMTRYYSNEERIQCWAHCYRINVGINTNMVLESLNRYIKKEKLQGNGYVRIEKLLNVLEEVVEDKMWKRIIAMQRTNRNSYQGSKVLKAHRAADELVQYVDMVSADIPSFANEDPLIGTGNATNEIKQFLMGKGDSNETESIDGWRCLENVLTIS